VVPHADFPVFRAAALRLLDDDAFALVEAVYRTAVADARREATLWRARQQGLDVRLQGHRGGAAALLQRATIDAASRCEVIVRLRALQVGFFREGLLVPLRLGPEPQLLAALRPRLAPTIVDRLRQLCDPATTAALTLALAVPARLDALAGVTVSAVAEHGHRLELGAASYRVPPRAAALVGAAGQNRPPDAPLLVDRAGAPLNPARLRTLLLRGAGHAGITPPPATAVLKTWNGSPSVMLAPGGIVDLRGDTDPAGPG